MNWSGQMGESSETETTISVQEAVVQYSICLATVRIFLTALEKDIFWRGKSKAGIAGGSAGALPKWGNSKGERTKILSWRQEEHAKALNTWETGEKCLRGQALSCWLVQWRKESQQCAMKQSDMVEGTAKRCGPHRGLKLGLSRSRWHFWRWEERSRDEALQAVLGVWRRKTRFVTEYDQLRWG